MQGDLNMRKEERHVPGERFLNEDGKWRMADGVENIQHPTSREESNSNQVTARGDESSLKL
jgi:hypothetical protein